MGVYPKIGVPRKSSNNYKKYLYIVQCIVITCHEPSKPSIALAYTADESTTDFITSRLVSFRNCWGPRVDFKSAQFLHAMKTHHNKGIISSVERILGLERPRDAKIH